MGKHPNYYNKAIHVLQELKKDFPNQSLGQHLATALDEYPDIWGLTDKEIVFALEKYQLEKGTNFVDLDDMDAIYKDAMNIDDPNYLNEEEEDY